LALTADGKAGGPFASGGAAGATEEPWGDGTLERTPATLVFNPNAGAGGTDPESLRAMLIDAGYDTSYRATHKPEELDSLLKETEGLVVVAGGDGTFREVAKRMVGGDRAVTLLPLGTANNAARTLGIEGPIKQVVAGLRRPRALRIDMIRTRGPWGEELAVEGAGLGVFANVLAAYRPDEGKSLLRAVGAAANALDRENAIRCRVELDGERLDGEYLLVEVMNMKSIGPRVGLAPTADPSDGQFDAVLVHHRNRDALFAYLRGLVTSGLSELRSVEVVRGRKLKVNWRGSAFHADAVSLCSDAREAGSKGMSAQIEIVQGALQLWLPTLPAG
jgi:diacylglycerol kinase (ATP)